MDLVSSKRGSDLLKMFFQSFIKSCGVDDLTLVAPDKKIDKPIIEDEQVKKVDQVLDAQSKKNEQTLGVQKEQPVQLFATRVIFTGILTSGLNICKIRDIWKTIPEAYRQDVSKVLETRTVEHIQFIVEFAKPLPGSLLANLLKWAERMGSVHLITIHVATQSVS